MMKKLWICCLAAALLLAACAAPGMGPTAPGPGEEPQPEEPADSPAPMPEAEKEPAGTEVPEDEDRTITLEANGLSLRLTLPEGWESEAFTDGAAGQYAGLALWPAEDPAFRPEVQIWAEGFPGMCGTGVTFEELRFSSGLSATKATETVAGTTWLTVIFQLDTHAPGLAVQASAPPESFTRYNEALTQILDSLRPA